MPLKNLTNVTRFHRPPGFVPGAFILFLSLVLGYPGVPSLRAGEVPAQAGESEALAARIISVEGQVRILTASTSLWTAALKDMPVHAGDKFDTGEGGEVDIAYDEYFMNVTHLKENTRAEILTVAPVNIRLEDGSVFNALDALKDNSYQITTDMAVIAVRGTHFDVDYDSQAQQISAASLETSIPGHESRIYVYDPSLSPETAVEVSENRQIDFRRGEPVAMDRIREVAPERREAGRKIFRGMEQRVPQFQEMRARGQTRFEAWKKEHPERQRDAGRREQKVERRDGMKPSSKDGKRSGESGGSRSGYSQSGDRMRQRREQAERRKQAFAMRRENVQNSGQKQSGRREAFMHRQQRDYTERAPQNGSQNAKKPQPQNRPGPVKDQKK